MLIASIQLMETTSHADKPTDRGGRCYTMSVSLGKRFLLGTLGAPGGVLGSGVDGPRRNQLLIAQIMKILEEQVQTESDENKI